MYLDVGEVFEYRKLGDIAYALVRPSGESEKVWRVRTEYGIGVDFQEDAFETIEQFTDGSRIRFVGPVC